MSLVNAVVVKVVLGTAAVALAGSGTAMVLDLGPGRSPRAQASAGVEAVAPVETTASGNGEIRIDPGTGAERLLNGEDAGAGAGTRVRTGGSGPGRQGPVGAPASITAGGATGPAGSAFTVGGTINMPSGGSSTNPGTGAAPGGSGGPSGGNGGSPPAGPGGSGGSGGSFSTPSAPSVPTPTSPAVPSSAAAYSEGSFTVVVPGTTGVSKKLCLSGTVVNRCQTLTVPAVRSVELTVAYSGNAGVEAPKFTTAPCPGGASVGVAGLTPGATLTVTVEGRQVSSTVPERDGRQTASLCDS